MKYSYFISFEWSRENGEAGARNCRIVEDRKITEYKQIEEIQKRIAIANRMATVAINNFILLEVTP